MLLNLVTSLQRQEVLRSDGIRPPHCLVEVLAVSSPELGSQMIDKLRSSLLYDDFELSELRNITSPVSAFVEMSTVHEPHIVAARLEFRNCMSPDCAACAGNQDPHR